MRFPQVRIVIDMPQQRFAGRTPRHDALSSSVLDNSGARRIEPHPVIRAFVSPADQHV
jgi:hypothetical protein